MKVDGDIFWERNIVRLWNYNSLCVTALQGRVRFCQHHMWSLVIINSTKQRSAVGVCVGGTIMKSIHSHCTAGLSQYKQSQMSQRNADILSHDYFKYYFTTVSFLVLFILHILFCFWFPFFKLINEKWGSVVWVSTWSWTWEVSWLPCKRASNL